MTSIMYVIVSGDGPCHLFLRLAFIFTAFELEFNSAADFLLSVIGSKNYLLAIQSNV